MYHQYDIEILHATREIVLEKDGLTEGVISTEEAKVLAKKLLKAVKEIDAWTDRQVAKSKGK